MSSNCHREIICFAVRGDGRGEPKRLVDPGRESTLKRRLPMIPCLKTALTMCSANPNAG